MNIEDEKWEEINDYDGCWVSSMGRISCDKCVDMELLVSDTNQPMARFSGGRAHYIALLVMNAFGFKEVVS